MLNKPKTGLTTAEHQAANAQRNYTQRLAEQMVEQRKNSANEEQAALFDELVTIHHADGIAEQKTLQAALVELMELTLGQQKNLLTPEENNRREQLVADLKNQASAIKDAVETLVVDIMANVGLALEQRDYTRRLAHQMIELRRTDAHDPQSALFNALIAVRNAEGVPEKIKFHEALDQLIELVWRSEKGAPTKQENDRREQLMEDLQSQSPEITTDGEPVVIDKTASQALVIDVMAHAGQLYQMMGLLARERLLKATDDTKNPIKQLLYKKPTDARRAQKPVLSYATADAAIKAFGQPAFEMTFTGHPTNTNSIASMEKQRALAAQLMADPRNGKKELLAFAQTPLLPTKNDKPTPLTVPEETDTMLYFLNNVYQDLPGTYSAFDRELATSYGAGYMPDALKLGYNFHSWGSSGDKDGNKKVNADTTLAAVAAHQAAILSNYATEIAVLGLDGPQAKAVTAAATEIARFNAEIRHTLDIRSTPEKEGAFTAQEFDDFSQALKAAGAALNQLALEAELTARIAATPMPYLHQADAALTADERVAKQQSEQPLQLLRRVRTFGFTFGHIEYRETAEEYERVMALLLPEYGTLMTPLRDAQKAYKALHAPLEKLRAAHDDAVRAQDEPLQQKLSSEIAHMQEELQPKLQAAELEIAAQKKALEKPRQDLLTAVLKDPAALATRIQAVEATLNDAAGKPYAEDDATPIAYQTLKRMELARDFPAMIQNNVLAECGGTSNMLEALVLQHAVCKDGHRAMMGIVPLFEEHATLKTAPEIVRQALCNGPYFAHLKTLAIARGARNTGINQQVQLAHSDNAKRAGVPAARALVYKAHDELRQMISLFNETYEGLNVNLQLFEGGSQSDPYRGGVRAISASINEFRLHDFTKMTYQGGDLLNYFNLPYSTQRLLTKCLSTQICGLRDKSEKKLKPFMTTLTNSIISMFDEVKSDYIDNLFNADTYVNFLNKIGYVFSGMFGNFSSRAPSRGGVSKQLTDINTTRAIGISETLQHAEIAATWVGLGDMEALLEKYKHQIGKSPTQLNDAYNQSPVFEDIIDRMMYGLVRTDLNYVDKVSRPNGHEDPLMEKFREDYGTAFKLCIEAYTRQPVEKFFKDHQIHGDLKDPAALRALVASDSLRKIIRAEIFPHVADTLGDQQRFLELSHAMEQWDVAKVNLNAPISDSQLLQNSLIHNMLDTVHHGRIAEIDDPSYAKLYCKTNHIPRPWAMNNMLRRQGQIAGVAG